MHARVSHLSLSLGVVVIGFNSPSEAVVVSDAFRTHYGSAQMDMFGLSVVNLGDLNHDEVEDYAVGAPGWTLATGRALVFSGSTGSQLFAFPGHGAGSLTGFAIANAGDVNADGTDDLIIGAPTKFNGQVFLGAAYVRSGADGTLIHSLEGVVNEGCFGWSVAGAGDVNGDGYDDFAVATPFMGTGGVEIFSGLDGSMIRQVTYGTSYGEFGRSIANIGDVNGDGFDELAIGAPYISKAFIYDSRHDQITRTFSLATGSEFGYAVANTGDVNDDGVNDVMIGAPNATIDGAAVGRVLFYSAISGSLLKQFSGHLNWGFGKSIGCISDFDGDGERDFIVGSSNLGMSRVDVLSGATGDSIWNASNGNGEELGMAVAGFEDLNGDGLGDLMVGHPGVINSDASGAVYLFSWGPVPPFILGSTYDYAVEGSTTIAVESHDLDHDGDLDIITLSNDTLSVYRNYGNGSYLAPKHHPVTNATGMAIADIDLDSKPDIVVCSFGMFWVKFFQFKANKLVYAGGFTGSAMPLAVTACDFDNDGRVDLALTDLTNSIVRVWHGCEGYSQFLPSYFEYSKSYPVGFGPVQMAAVHLNSDSKLDLAILNKDEATVSILSNKGNGKFAIRPKVMLEGTPYCMTFADFNADGKQDLATVISGSNLVSLRNGKPSFAFAAPTFHAVGSQPRSVLARDVSGDQVPDLITTNWAQDVVTVQLRSSSGFELPLTCNTGLDPASAAIGDFDNDGDNDIVTLNKTSRTISIVPNESLD